MLTNEEKQLTYKAFNAAVKASEDAIAAARLLIPVLEKIFSEQTFEQLDGST
jgi:hypothetical protein